jgi:hypothetical protein
VILNRRLFIAAWLWGTGLICLGLPYFWWPRQFSGRTVLLITLFILALGFVVSNLTRNGLFGGERSPIRGLAGVFAFSAVIFGNVLAYRLLIL